MRFSTTHAAFLRRPQALPHATPTRRSRFGKIVANCSDAGFSAEKALFPIPPMPTAARQSFGAAAARPAVQYASSRSTTFHAFPRQAYDPRR